jgi:hypothetical protein
VCFSEVQLIIETASAIMHMSRRTNCCWRGGLSAYHNETTMARLHNLSARASSEEAATPIHGCCSRRSSRGYHSNWRHKASPQDGASCSIHSQATMKKKRKTMKKIETKNKTKRNAKSRPRREGRCRILAMDRRTLGPECFSVTPQRNKS